MNIFPKSIQEFSADIVISQLQFRICQQSAPSGCVQHSCHHTVDTTSAKRAALKAGESIEDARRALFVKSFLTQDLACILVLS